MTWTLCTSGSAITKAGLAASGSYIVGSGSLLAGLSDEAEATICSIARYDVITNYANLKANGKNILQQLSSALVAEDIVNYQQTAYATGEAISLLNVLENKIKRNIDLISEDKIKTYLLVAT